MKTRILIVLFALLAAAVLAGCAQASSEGAEEEMAAEREEEAAEDVEARVAELEAQLAEAEADRAALEEAAIPEVELEPLVIGFSWNEKQHSVIEAWQDYMVSYSETACPKAGFACEWIFNVADSDPVEQASNIEDLINQDVDIVVARAHDAAAIGASVRAAQDADIPFITFDRESATVQPTMHVGGDSYMQAVSTGRKFAEILEEEGVEDVKCIEVMGDLRDMNAVYRSEGWADVETELGAWETVAQVPTEWNPEKFLSGTAAALEAHPEANCLFAHSDYAFDSVLQAMDAAGRLHPRGEEGHLWVASQDIMPPGYAAMQEGYIDVGTTWDAYYHAVELVNAVLRVASGEPIGQYKVLVPGRVATPDILEDMPNMWARDYD